MLTRFYMQRRICECLIWALELKGGESVCVEMFYMGKTGIIWLGSAGQLQRWTMTPLFITFAWITPSPWVCNLCEIINGALAMSAQVNKMVSICFFHLRQLRLVRRTMDVDAAHAYFRALFHCRFNYSNSVLAGPPAYMFMNSSLSWIGSARPSIAWPSEYVNLDGKRGCIGSDFHIESPTSFMFWFTKFCRDRNPTTCLDDVFDLTTFLAMHISVRLQLDSSRCQLRTKRWLGTKGSHTVTVWHETISLCISGVTTAPHH